MVWGLWGRYAQREIAAGFLPLFGIVSAPSLMLKDMQLFDGARRPKTKRTISESGIKRSGQVMVCFKLFP
jgi:hypothetical protein